MMSFFRYPGGKSKLRDEIAGKLKVYATDKSIEYREPFFGGGSIGLKFISDQPQWTNVWINDKDPGVACLWTSVIRYPDDLKELVGNFKPTVAKFDDYKTELLEGHPIPRQRSKIVEYGFKKLAIHQISYSGLGTKSGGPLGGRDQKSKYPIDCRWSPDYISKKIDKLHIQFSKLNIRNNECTCLDFEELIQDNQQSSLIYLDPPYYVKGGDLYQHSFNQTDHERLANTLSLTAHRWVLSYDACDEIRDLYEQWSSVGEIDGVNYSITATKDKDTGNRLSRTKPEFLITPKNKELINAIYH